VESWQTTGSGKTNYFPAGYSTDGSHITWSPAEGPFELYFMPAPSLDAGTAAYYQLTGPPLVPPLYAFGFTASRWGWGNRSYIESVLNEFRSGSYPIDAFITDFGWFTNVSDYTFSPAGEPWYDDFGFAKATFPEPAAQLAEYHAEPLGYHMGGIRKPRLGNTALLKEALAKGFILPGGERRGVGYADQRNINFSIPEARDWYAEKQAHYISDGVDFFWNDEGETDYFTFHNWNVAQLQTLRSKNATRRFYSLNRAWTPGMARLGAAVWTGDINPSWQDLAGTPGMVLNWGLGGAPYVACDIGGFTGQTEALLLTRWFQVGVFMPIMRVHSTLSATPHFPFLWPEPYRSAMREALELRYRLIPYHYSLAHGMYQTGRLWMRPLIAEYPGDARAAEMTTQWLDGSIMASPVLAQDGKVATYLPKGTWFEFNSTKTHAGPTTLTATPDVAQIPVFVPAGSVLTLGPVVQHTQALPGGPLEVQVYSGQDGAFQFVEDDGESTAYEGKATRVTSFLWNNAKRTLTWTVADSANADLPHGFDTVYTTVFDAGATPISSNIKKLGTGGSVVFN